MLYPYLEQRWREHLDLFGQRSRQGNHSGPQYPKSQPDASRRDAWPPGGGRPGSDLDFMRTHHLDANSIELGILTMIRPHPGGFQNLDLSAALCRAINDWQVAEWTAAGAAAEGLDRGALRRRRRLRGRDRALGRASATWCRSCCCRRTVEPLGHRRYWPIYRGGGAGRAADRHPRLRQWRAADHRHGLAAASTSRTWSATRNPANPWSAAWSSRACSRAFPSLKIVLIEAGFGWLPRAVLAHGPGLEDAARARRRALTRQPSEYIREHFWLTTQPMEEPDAAQPSARHDRVDRLGPAAVRDRLPALGL